MPGYYDLQDDMRIPGRWHLRSPRDERGQAVAPWQFRKGQRIAPPGMIRFPVGPGGIPQDFTLASSAIPVVHARVVRLLERLGAQDQVQFLPARIEGHEEPYFILNTLRVIRCIDDARSEEVRYWKPEDNRPDKEGEYRNVAGLRIAPSKVGGSLLFRPWGWTIALIVSEELKHAMEQEGVTGTKFVAA
ncbi:imm11 family protein [Hyalangium gracile]|uniref:imm11 family protein n=1 Tax=Hyalangium gracile TaxID=394092 RepID=UPI001CCC9D05|nr:DUF1629 domain-containing protein [Hyalangium gracile]